MNIASPPSRAIMMVAAALDIPLNLQEINVVQGDQMDPDYIKVLIFINKVIRQ